MNRELRLMFTAMCYMAWCGLKTGLEYSYTDCSELTGLLKDSKNYKVIYMHVNNDLRVAIALAGQDGAIWSIQGKNEIQKGRVDGYILKDKSFHPVAI